MSIYFKNDLSFNFIYNKKKKMVKIPAYKLIKDIAQYVKIVYNLPRDSKVFYIIIIQILIIIKIKL